ncbi:MAG: TrkA family potassium uptake protein [Saprospirales bacterium]|jgi:trk system potassium uptake protein TrkA|nr:TrkA family potassium uptake protein [Saprospirales bacterium]MBK6902722.1 TrkA family potassium uptake protein [Saprospirales bacterium]MBK7336930.1 TrkA family potassium uptake protein [Saprospirales bacterium]
MKVIIFGLGNFGQSLALYLTETGSEVIGVDKDLYKVELIKDKIAHTVSLDSTNEMAFEVLPLKDTDVAVVAIGENEGAAIITTAILKKYPHIKIISRSLSPIHDTVLQAMGVHMIVHPEQEAAERLTRKLNFKKVLENFIVDEHYSISEIRLPTAIEGKTIQECGFREKHRLNIITILRKKEKANILGRKISYQESIGLPTPDMKFEKGDVLVVFGSNNSIENYCNVNKIPEDQELVSL